jgi:hypothetical protein
MIPKATWKKDGDGDWWLECGRFTLACVGLDRFGRPYWQPIKSITFRPSGCRTIEFGSGANCGTVTEAKRRAEAWVGGK